MPNTWVVILASIAATLLAVLLFQNFSTSEKKIDERLPKLYQTDAAEFRRSLSALHGPPLVEGNQVETLLNGVATCMVGSR